VPEPLANLLALQQARIKLGQAGARAVTITRERMSVTPVDLDEARQQRLREELPEARYEPGRAQVSLKVPQEPGERLPAVVRAADGLLAAVRAAA
jgi:transcription-repair coupling factor (superfamily II helicase)